MCACVCFFLRTFDGFRNCNTLPDGRTDQKLAKNPRLAATGETCSGRATCPRRSSRCFWLSAHLRFRHSTINQFSACSLQSAPSACPELPLNLLPQRAPGVLQKPSRTSFSDLGLAISDHKISYKYANRQRPPQSVQYSNQTNPPS